MDIEEYSSRGLSSDRLLTTKQAAQYAQVTRSTMTRWCRGEGLPVIRTPRGDVIRLSDLKAYLEAHRRYSKLSKRRSRKPKE